MEANDRKAQESREILDWVGIHIDSAANGVILPSISHDDSEAMTLHTGSHTAEYSQLVNEALRYHLDIHNKIYHFNLGYHAPEGAQQVVANTLRFIRDLLRNRPVPINRAVDQDYSPDVPGNTNSVMRQMFIDAGLVPNLLPHSNNTHAGPNYKNNNDYYTPPHPPIYGYSDGELRRLLGYIHYPDLYPTIPIIDVTGQ